MDARTFYATTYVVADGVTVTWPFSFAGVNGDRDTGTTPYLYPEDVKVQEMYTDAAGNKQTVQRFGVLNTPNAITITGAPVERGREIRIYRETELRFPLVDYRDLQSVSEHDLDLANRQAVFLAQETRDTASANLLYDKQGHFNAGMRRIVELADGIDPQDAATVKQLMHAVRSADVPLKPLPDAPDRAGKVLTFDGNGNPSVAIPASESALALAIRLASSGGSTYVEYKDRTVWERLEEEVYIRDAPFNAKMDGVTDDSAAWNRFIAYLMTNGGRGKLGKGKLFIGTGRLYAIESNTATFKSFTIEGEGAEYTKIIFGNISPEFDATGKITKNEPHLFLVQAINNKVGARCGFRGFSFDYSQQVFKGGASRATPGLTDIKPVSTGVHSFYIESCNGVDIDDIVGTEVYGNGVILSRTPYSNVNRVRGYNISGGNPGSADSTGGFIALMRGSQVGSNVNACIGINTRVYQTDTVGGFNDRTAKDTMCGYIGIWTEYGIEIDRFAPTTELWGAVEPKNGNSLGCTVTGCFVYGYTLGYKMEGYTPCVFNACVAINCWIPYIGGGSQGRVVNCYADGGKSDLLTCPQSGYEYIRGLFVHYNVNTPVWAFSGFTYDGCMGFTRRMRINTTNCNSGLFLNQQIVMASNLPNADMSILATRSNKAMYAAKVSGTYIIREMAADYSSILYDMAELDMDVNIINLTDKVYTLSPTKYHSAGEGCARAKVKVRFDGLVRVAVSGAPGARADVVGSMTDPTKKFLRNVLTVSADDSQLYFRLRLHAGCIPEGSNNFGYVDVSGEMPNVDGQITFTGDVPHNVKAMVFSNAIQPTWRLAKDGDEQGLAMIIHGTTARGGHLESIRTNDMISPVFDIRYTLFGPITYNAGSINAGKMTHVPLAYEPNHPTRLAADRIHYTPGLMLPYIRPVLGGKMGCRVNTGGLRAAAYTPLQTVSLNAMRATDSQVYKATTAGTTAADTPPTHTAGTSTDGTVVWTWVAPRAMFEELAAASGTLI